MSRDSCFDVACNGKGSLKLIALHGVRSASFFPIDDDFECKTCPLGLLVLSSFGRSQPKECSHAATCVDDQEHLRLGA